nr:MAG TPA: hypothetical protein [Caudoviricetes sp.]
MGFGGILAAMAQGLGTGIIKNVEQGWKSEETDKLLDWRTKEADKQRQHDFELEDHRSRNAISEAAARARISAQYSRSGSSDGNSQAQKNFMAVTQTYGIYASRDQELAKMIKGAGTEEQKEELIKQREFNRKNMLNYLEGNAMPTLKAAGDMGYAFYLANGGRDSAWNDITPTPVTGYDIAKSTANAVLNQPLRKDSQSNMVDMNNLSAKEVAQLAKQKQEEQSRMNFAKASEEAKEWAAKRNQYTPSTFIPRPF